MRLIRSVAVLVLTAAGGWLTLFAMDTPATDSAFAAGALHTAVGPSVSATAIAADSGARLRVRATGVESDQGMIRVALFANAGTFNGDSRRRPPA